MVNFRSREVCHGDGGPYVTTNTAVGNIGTDGNLSLGSASNGVPTSIPVTGGQFTASVPYGVTTFVGTAH